MPMMQPVKTAPCNMNFVPPANWDEAKFGPCKTLSVFKSDGMIVSWWKPSWRDRLRLLFGRKIRLTVISNNMPPVSVEVCPNNL